MDLLTELAILVLAAFVGFEVISKVPNTLHTPLMSGTNAIHGIVVLGGLLLIGPAEGFLNDLLLVIAIAFGTINVVGGFLVTDRMLGMFKGEPRRSTRSSKSEPRRRHPAALHRGLRDVHHGAADAARAAHGGARQPGRGGRHGDRGRSRRCCTPGVGDWLLIVLGVAIGVAVGVPAARSVKMTAMPQMVALFNGVGGGAVALISWSSSGASRTSRWRADPDPVRGDHRLDLLLGLEHRVPEAAGADEGRLGTPKVVNGAAAGDRGRAGGGDRGGLGLRAAVLADPAVGGRARCAGRDADRRRRHAGRDLDLERVHGLSAAAAGIALDNTALIVAGMLVGASGSILTKQMAEAMNRSIANVISCYKIRHHQSLATITNTRMLPKIIHTLFLFLNPMIYVGFTSTETGSSCLAC